MAEAAQADTAQRKGLVAIIIGNYNGMSFSYKGIPILERCIKNLLKTDYPNYRIVLSDLSSDESAAYVRKKYPRIDIVKSSGESFCAESNNDAIKYCLKHMNPDYIVRIDNDIIITDRKWLAKMVAEAEKDPTIGVESCKLLYPDGKIQHAGITLGVIPKTRGRGEIDDGRYDSVEDIGAIIGAMFFVSRSALEKTGLIDENLLGLEDIDYCYEARKHGFRVVYNGSAYAMHLEGFTTSNSKIKSRMDKRFYARLEGYSYLVIKQYGPLMKCISIPVWLLRTVFMIKQKDRKRSMLGVRLRPDAFSKFRLGLKALRHAYILYNMRKKRFTESKMKRLRRIGF